MEKEDILKNMRTIRTNMEEVIATYNRKKEDGIATEQDFIEFLRLMEHEKQHYAELQEAVLHHLESK